MIWSILQWGKNLKSREIEQFEQDAPPRVREVIREAGSAGWLRAPSSVLCWIPRPWLVMKSHCPLQLGRRWSVWPFPLTSAHFLRTGLKEKKNLFNPKVPVVLTWREGERKARPWVRCACLPPGLRLLLQAGEQRLCPSWLRVQNAERTSRCFWNRARPRWAAALHWPWPEASCSRSDQQGARSFTRSLFPWWLRTVKNLPAMEETRVRSLGREDPLEKGLATRSSILAWTIPWTEEPGGLQPMGSQRVRQDRGTNTFTSGFGGGCGQVL